MQKSNLTASEALYSFIGWLTTRKERSVISASDNAAPAAVLVNHFIKVQGIQEPREDWPKCTNIIPMNERDIVTLKPLAALTKEDAQGALFSQIGGAPKGFEIIKLEGTIFTFFYNDSKNRRKVKNIDILSLGFNAFKYLQSQSYEL